MKTFRQIITLWIMALAILSSCSQDESLIESHGTPFSLSVSNGPLADSRAVVETDFLPNSAHLGVRLVKSGSTDLYLSTTSHLLFTHSSASYGSWSTSTSIYLNGALGTAYAYYPYNSSVTDFTQIPIESGTTDYMYGQSILDVNDGSPQAMVYMHHALAAVRLSFISGTASSMTVNSVTLNGGGYNSTARLNAFNGELTALENVGELVYETPFEVTATAQNIDYLLIPSGVSAPLSFSITDGNGKEQTITTESVKLQSGKLYTIQLSADYGGKLTYSSVRIGDWSYSDEGKPVITTGNFAITCEGNTDGIAFSNTVASDGTVTVVAVPVISGDTVNEVVCSDGASITQTLGYNGARTIVLTDIKSDVTLTFNGVD